MQKKKRKYGPIESMSLLRRDGKAIAHLTFLQTAGSTRKTIKAKENMLIRIVTRDEQGHRVTFFMKKT